MARPTRDRRIFFPWEGARGLRRWLALGRIRPFAIGGSILGFVILVAVRERRESGVRQTRAEILDVRRSVDAYLADHDGGCPSDFSEIRSEVPRDAWGRKLRLICPSPHPGMDYELMSDGPDGEPGGLDRVE